MPRKRLLRAYAREQAEGKHHLGPSFEIAAQCLFDTYVDEVLDGRGLFDPGDALHGVLHVFVAVVLMMVCVVVMMVVVGHVVACRKMEGSRLIGVIALRRQDRAVFIGPLLGRGRPPRPARSCFSPPPPPPTGDGWTSR